MDRGGVELKFPENFAHESIDTYTLHCTGRRTSCACALIQVAQEKHPGQSVLIKPGQSRLGEQPRLGLCPWKSTLVPSEWANMGVTLAVWNTHPESEKPRALVSASGREQASN